MGMSFLIGEKPWLITLAGSFSNSFGFIGVHVMLRNFHSSGTDILGYRVF